MQVSAYDGMEIALKAQKAANCEKTANYDKTVNYGKAANHVTHVESLGQI